MMMVRISGPCTIPAGCKFKDETGQYSVPHDLSEEDAASFKLWRGAFFYLVLERARQLVNRD